MTNLTLTDRRSISNKAKSESATAAAAAATAITRIRTHGVDSNAEVSTWLAGMAADIDKIHSNIKETLIALNCNHQVGIHILLKLSHQAESFQRELHAMQSKILKTHNNACWRHYAHDHRYKHEECHCAPIIIQSEDDLQTDSSKIRNRIDRIAAIRDSQRYALHEIYSSHRNRIRALHNAKTNTVGIIILVDLDLFTLPKTSLIMEQIYQLQKTSYPLNAICAAGITMNLGQNSNSKAIPEPWYYDTFATVFLPDTFSHPIKRRLVPHLYHGEDPQLVRSNNQRGNFTQGDIFRYFQAQGLKKNVSMSRSEGVSDGLGCTRVKSCFGGMALYRAANYFEQYCTYQLQESIRDQLEHWHDSDNIDSDYVRGKVTVNASKSIIRYANNKERRPCEHVVFHDCLMKVTSGQFEIAVNPALKTFWKRDF